MRYGSCGILKHLGQKYCNFGVSSESAASGVLITQMNCASRRKFTGGKISDEKDGGRGEEAGAATREGKREIILGANPKFP